MKLGWDIYTGDNRFLLAFIENDQKDKLYSYN